MPKAVSFEEALKTFSGAVTSKLNQITHGEPEEQLRGPFENLIRYAGRAFGMKTECTGETPLPDRLGRPDYAVHVNRLLAGFVELKAPGVGANHRRFKDRNKRQWKRFSSLPNILYTDGNEWIVYRNGEPECHARLSGDVSRDGVSAADPRDAAALETVLRDFLTWQPFIPKGCGGKIDLKAFADMLAPLCRLLREEVAEALADPESPLVRLAEDWRQLLFPDATDDQFADAYAQTVVFALLLGRGEGADPLTLDSAQKKLKSGHSLLSRALMILTDESPNDKGATLRNEIKSSVDILLRVIGTVPPITLTGPEDPWLYFYEDFLAAYDPNLRKDAGAYYTPVEVVRAQVRLVGELLTDKLGKAHGYTDPGVVTLDPAAGTGTYLLGVVEHALERAREEQGEGAVAGQASQLAQNLYGFEKMVGPYAVSELRVTRALRDRGAQLPGEGTHIYLTDTLESPHATPPDLPTFLRPIADQHFRALRVKSEVPVIVCLGNPPYDRHAAVDTEREANLGNYGGWVRFGDPLIGGAIKDDEGRERKLKTAKARIETREQLSIFYKDFVKPAIDAGHAVHVKNIYNLYVYFWRWALWKVFESDTAGGPGVAAFITASSFLDGDAFSGMRGHMRALCDEIWVLDLGGEGRGTRRDDNVFAIQTPVAITIAVRYGKSSSDEPAKVWHARVEGTREEKLRFLDEIAGFESVEWLECRSGSLASFRPAGVGNYFDWPLLTDLMPWQHSGVQLKRTWPICHDPDTLRKRWRILMNSEDRAALFKETRDRKIHKSYKQPPGLHDDITPILLLEKDCEPPRIIRCSYRSFNRQWIFADNRIGDYYRIDLLNLHSNKQLYLTSLLTKPLGDGPAVTACSEIPDLDHFSGRGAKDIIPLYRDNAGEAPNILTILLDRLRECFGIQDAAEMFVSYLYGILAQPAFTEKYSKELESRELRAPVTKDAKLFVEVAKIGAKLLCLHTYGERFLPKNKKRKDVIKGRAKCVKPVPGTPGGYPETFEYIEAAQTLRVGEGEFKPVPPEVYRYEVSGLKVAQSWLRYRMKAGAGKKSSPLDDIRPERWTAQFTTELLELLWVLEATVAIHPKQAELLERVTAGECVKADELPEVPPEMRKPPSANKTEEGGLFEGLE